MYKTFRFLTWPVLVGLLLVCASAFAQKPKFKNRPLEKFEARDGVGNVLEKLNKGETVRIAYFGAATTAAKNGWRPQSLEWFKKTWPNANIEEIDASIRGTGLTWGVYRFKDDVLDHNPDLIFVDYAVQHHQTSPNDIWRYLESIVRQAWEKNPRIDIVFLHGASARFNKQTEAGNAGRSAAAMDMLADFYGIPSINAAVPVKELEKAGKLLLKGGSAPDGVILYSKDGVHPTKEGHTIVAETVAAALDAMKSQKPVDHAAKLKKTFFGEYIKSPKTYQIKKSMLEGDWVKVGSTKGVYKQFSRRLGDTIWYSKTPGSKLTFKFKGTEARITDLLSTNGGQLIITVDGKTAPKPVARFDSWTTGYRVSVIQVATKLDPNEVHTVTVEIHPDEPDRSVVAPRLKDAEKELASAKYKGHAIWLGKLLIDGELVE